MAREYGKALPLETKANGDVWEVTGYLSTFGNVDTGGDVILPTAFDASLASGRRVKFLFAHDDTKPLGPPLTLTKDDHGLRATGRLSKTSLGADVHLWLQEGALDSWSIGYWPTDVEFREGADGDMVRVLKQVDLLEGSIVAIPMNEEAVVTGVKAGCVCTPNHGLAYDQHAARVEQIVQEFLARSAAGAEQRKAEGRALSPERIAALARMSGSLQTAQAALDALTVTGEPKCYATEWALLQTRLRLAGVEVAAP